MLWQLGRPADAIALLEPAIAGSPQSGVLYEAAAIAYGKLDRFEDAVAAARRALALNPTSGKLHLLLAFKLGAANRPRDALGSALVAMRLEPGNSSAHMAVSEASRRCGDRAQALRHAREALRLAPDRHSALMGRVLLSHERWEEADGWLRRGYAGHPDAWDGCFYLALALIPQGRIDEAKAMVETFLGRRPDDKMIPLLWERLAQWQRREPELRAAIAGVAAQRARAARLELAALHASQDRLAEAVDGLEAILQDRPHDEPVRVRLEEIRERTARCGSGEEVARPAMAALEDELRDEYHRRRLARQPVSGAAGNVTTATTVAATRG